MCDARFGETALICLNKDVNHGLCVRCHFVALWINEWVVLYDILNSWLYRLAVLPIKRIRNFVSFLFGIKMGIKMGTK